MAGTTNKLDDPFLVTVDDKTPAGKHPVLSAWFAIMCTMAGTGILQLPYTLKQGGWLCLGLIILVALMTNTTAKWLIRCLYPVQLGEAHHLQTEPERLEDYPAIGAKAYGRCGRILVQIFHKATLLGVTTIFLILSGKFLLEGIGGDGEGVASHLGGPGDTAKWTTRWTLVSAGIVMIPVVCLRSIGEIAPLAAFGMTASMICVLEVVIFAFLLKPVTSETQDKFNLPLPNTFDGTTSYKVFDVELFPTAFAAITLSFGGHAVFPSIEQHMPRPQAFPKAMNLAYIALVIMYFVTAIMGYWAFGDSTYSPILCNFPRGTESVMGALTEITKLIVALHVMCAYPILMNVVVRESERGLQIDTVGKEDTYKNLFFRTSLRAGLVSLTCVFAICVPYFAEVMSLVGALCLTMIVFVLPVVFTFKLRGSELSMPQKMWGVLIIAVGVTGGTIGSVQAIVAIAQKLKDGDPQ